MYTFRNAALLLLVLVFFACKKSVADSPAEQTSVDRLLLKGEDLQYSNTMRVKYIDSAYTVLEDFANDSLTRLYYRRAAVAYFSANDYVKSLKAGKDVYELGKKAKDTLSMAKGMYFSGLSYYNRHNNDSAFSYYDAAQKLYEPLEDNNTLGEIILYKAYIYYHVGEYVYCESDAAKALKLFDKSMVYEIYNCYNLMASAVDGQDNNEEAIKYYNLAIAQIDNFKAAGFDDAFIGASRASCYNNLSLVYVKMGQYEKATKLNLEALDFLNGESHDPLLYSRLLNNLGYTRLKAGNYTKLPELFTESLAIRDSLNDRAGVVNSTYNLGEYYLSKKDTVNAIKYVKKAYDKAKSIKSHFDIRNSLKTLAEIDRGNSVFYADKYVDVTDSLAVITRRNRDRFARVAYETDRLQDENNELNRRNTYIVGIGLVVLLFVAAIFVIYYLNSRNKELMLLQEQQKANEEIYKLMFEQQGKIDSARDEEKNRIAMELHDGILNNIYAVRLNLEFSNRKTDDETVVKRKGYIKELQQVESEIRAVSHNLSRSTIFNQNNDFASILGYMVTSQKNTFNTHFDAHIDKDINWDEVQGTIKINLYRIIQESLQNINKYSQAENAVLEITKLDKKLVVKVTDDGVGFNTQAASAGIGIKNLKQRAVAVGGDIAIISAPGKGAVIELQIPA